MWRWVVIKYVDINVEVGLFIKAHNLTILIIFSNAIRSNNVSNLTHKKNGIASTQENTKKKYILVIKYVRTYPYWSVGGYLASKNTYSLILLYQMLWSFVNQKT